MVIIIIIIIIIIIGHDVNLKSKRNSPARIRTEVKTSKGSYATAASCVRYTTGLYVSVNPLASL